MEENARIVVSFEEKDNKLLETYLVSGVTFISAYRVESPDILQINPLEISGFDALFSQLFRAAFMQQKEKQTVKLLEGFANNLYECTIFPICSYIKVLDDTLNALKESHSIKAIEVIFPNKRLYNKKSSAYYMAEHESQGKRFYSREAIMLPYLIDVCKNYGVSIKFINKRAGLLHGSFGAIRLAAVYIYRLLTAVRAASFFKQGTVSADVAAKDMLVVTRAVSQTETLSSFMAESSLNFALLCSQVFLRRSSNFDYAKEAFRRVENVSVQDIQSSLGSTLRHYFTALKLLLSRVNWQFDFCSVKLDLTQALREVIVMWPDLMIYHDSVSCTIGAMRRPRLQALVSAEQKSPFACADADIAKQHGLVCLHVMCCDQSSRPLPCPVFGDYFLVDNYLNAASFSKRWRDEANKVKYIGSFKGIIDGVESKRRTGGWCFFMQVIDVEVNKKVLKLLESSEVLSSKKLLVKLHPRDSADNYSEFGDFIFMDSNSSSKDILFSKFDFAITFPSGVVTDLIFMNKPFLLLRFGYWGSVDYPYIDNYYQGNIAELKNLVEKIGLIDSIKKSFVEFRKRFFVNNKIETNALNIEDKLVALLKQEGEACSFTPEVTG